MGPGRTDRQVVVESSDWPGVVRQNSLGGQEWVEGLYWSALQRERSPLDRCERPERFTLDRSWWAVVDLVVRDRLERLDRLDRLDRLGGLYKRLDGVMSWRLDMVGPVCGMLSMVGSMGGMFSRLLGMLAMVFVVVMIVTISRHQGEHH